MGSLRSRVALTGSVPLTLSLLTLSGAHLVTHVFGRLHTALFPVFRREFNLSLQQLGLLAAVPPLCQMLLYVPSGLLADRLGQKTLLAASFLAAGAAAIAMNFSSDVIFLTIFLTILLSSITIYHPPAYSLTSEISPREVRGRALGIHGAGGTLGMALGPITLSLFMGTLLWDWRRVYLFWAFPNLLYIAAIQRLRPRQRGPSSGRRGEEVAEADEPTRTPGIRSILTAGFLVLMVFQAARNMGNQILDTFISTYIYDVIGLTVPEASLVYGVSALTGVAAAPMGGYLADRLGDKRWLTMALGLDAVSLLLSSLAKSAALFAPLYWLSGFFFYSSMGAASSIIARSTPRGRRGLGYALYFLPGSIVGVFSPIISASAASAFGLWIIFPLSVGMTGLSLLILRLFPSP